MDSTLTGRYSMLFPRIRLRLACIALLLRLASSSASEVFFLYNGEIQIGDIVSSNSGILTIMRSGERATLPTSSILWYVPDNNVLMGLPVSVEMNNGSALNGTISDFDPDIGVFLEMDFGSLLIPNSTIKAIKDPVQGKRYRGPSAVAALGASYVMSWDFASFDAGPAAWSIEGGLSWATSLLRGLYAGFDASARFASSPDGGAGGILLSAGPGVSYRFLNLQQRRGFVGAFTPFAELDACPGFAFGYPDRADGLALTLAAKLGTDIKIVKGTGIRVQAACDASFGTGAPTLSVAAGVLISIER
jgi:hypothetical protein